MSTIVGCHPIRIYLLQSAERQYHCRASLSCYLLPHGFNERGLPLLVDAILSSKMAREMALVEKLCENDLLHDRRLSLERSPSPGKQVYRSCWNHQVAQAQGGEQHLAKGSHVQDTADLV
jgi:hypothetical protein